MYEFTESAKKVIEIAKNFSAEHNYSYVGTEQILYGLIAEDEGLAANILKKQDLTAEYIEDEIVKIVKEILAKEDITKEQIVKVVQQIDLMKKSILTKAFRGELGTNNSDEESAVELLKSILADS